MEYFEAALSHVLAYEGGYVDHPSDPGGATNRGVTQGTYDAYRADNGWPKQPVRNISDDEVADIYRTRYWDAIGADELPPALAFVVFDSAVNHGVSRTLGWLDDTYDWRELLLIRLSFYVSLSTFDTFGKGWARRLANVREAAEQYETDTPISTGRILTLYDTVNRELSQHAIPDNADVLLRTNPDGTRYWLRFDERKPQ